MGAWDIQGLHCDQPGPRQIIQCTLTAGNPCNPDMSPHSLPGTCHNELEGERKGDRKALTNRPANSSIL